MTVPMHCYCRYRANLPGWEALAPKRPHRLVEAVLLAVIELARCHCLAWTNFEIARWRAVGREAAVVLASPTPTSPETQILTWTRWASQSPE